MVAAFKRMHQPLALHFFQFQNDDVKPIYIVRLEMFSPSFSQITGRCNGVMNKLLKVLKSQSGLMRTITHWKRSVKVFISPIGPHCVVQVKYHYTGFVSCWKLAHCYWIGITGISFYKRDQAYLYFYTTIVRRHDGLSIRIIARNSEFDEINIGCLLGYFWEWKWSVHCSYQIGFKFSYLVTNRTRVL